MKIDARINALSVWRNYHTQQHRSMIATNIARKLAELDRADPFKFRRIYCHLMNNTHCPEDFGFQSKDGAEMGRNYVQ